MRHKITMSILLSIVSLAVFAQNDYYYYKGQRIPLTINPKKVNVISMTNGPQFAPSMQPNSLPNGLEVESVIANSPYNMCIIKENENVNGLLNNYINTTINPNYFKVLPTYINAFQKEIVPSNYIYVKLKSSSDFLILQTLSNQYNLSIIHQNAFMPLWFVVSLTNQTPYKTLEMANILYESGFFYASEPDFMLEGLEYISWDDNVYKQWGLYNATYPVIDINISSAWNYATGRGVKIGIIDSGVNHTHDDLESNMSCHKYDTETSTIRWTYYSDHGTHVAGIVASESNNGMYGAGVAPNSEIVAISNKLTMYPLETEKISNGLNWAVQNGVDVINCSWGWQQLQIITDAIDNAVENGRNGKGCVLVKSAGNNGDNGAIITFPGNYRSEILTVGAITKNGIRASFSGYGIALDVVAPGVEIYSTIPENHALELSGTSMAAPHVAGIAALILELNPDLTGQQVRDIIEQSTTKVGNLEYTNTVGRPNGTWNVQYGYGLVDALKAVQNTPRKQIDY